VTFVFALTSEDVFEKTGSPTGTWFEEFLVPYYALRDAGVALSIATPKGGNAPIDPASIEALKGNPIYERFLTDVDFQSALRHARKLEDVDPAETTGILYPGGYGPMFDLRRDKDSIGLIESLFADNKPVATICHGASVLLDATKPDGSALVDGMNLTSFTDSEEAAVSMVEFVPYLVETELRKKGAQFSKTEDWGDHSVQDGYLITGQNPASSAAVANKVLAMLNGG
jgi:putative intracellular protease/amidase